MMTVLFLLVLPSEIPPSADSLALETTLKKIFPETTNSTQQQDLSPTLFPPPFSV